MIAAINLAAELRGETLIMQLAKYVAVFNLGLQNTFVYRWNYFLRALFGLIPLAGTVFLWRAVFNEKRRRHAGLRLRLDDLLLSAHDPRLESGHADRGRMANRRRHSRRPDQFLPDQAAQLSRLSLQHFSQRTAVYTVVTILPIALIFFYFRGYLTLPSDPIAWVCAFISLLMAAMIQFFITYSIAMMAFWILEISTIVFIVYSFEYFLGGQCSRSTSCRRASRR